MATIYQHKILTMKMTTAEITDLLPNVLDGYSEIGWQVVSHTMVYFYQWEQPFMITVIIRKEIQKQ